MTFSEEQLRSANKKASKLMKKNGIEGCGIGDQVIRVYVSNDDARKFVPEEIDDVPVEIIATGKFRG